MILLRRVMEERVGIASQVNVRRQEHHQVVSMTNILAVDRENFLYTRSTVVINTSTRLKAVQKWRFRDAGDAEPAILVLPHAMQLREDSN